MHRRLVTLFVLLVSVAVLRASTPYRDTPASIPGIVQAEDFDHGTDGFKDTTPGNAGASYPGGGYRQTDVDMNLADDVGGGFNVGWVTPGEWVQYTVDVTEPGSYRLDARVAANGTGGTFHVEFNGADKTGAITVPATGGWQRWQTVSRTVTLEAGVQPMRLVFDTKGTYAVGNFNWITLTSVPPPPPTSTTAFRVATWNVHKGIGSSGAVNPKGQAQLIQAHTPHVVAMQEVRTIHAPVYEQELERLSGVGWTSYFSPHPTASWVGRQTLTRLPVSRSAFTRLAVGNATAVMVEVNVGAVPVRVFNTHLEYYNYSWRVAQLKALLEWARPQPAPRLLLGDFNSRPQEPLTLEIKKDYSDTWQDVTGSDAGGTTHGASRFDYVFRSRASAERLTPQTCVVVDTPLSDHRMVVAEFKVQ